MACHATGGESRLGWAVTGSRSQRVCGTTGTWGWDSASPPILCRMSSGPPADEARGDWADSLPPHPLSLLE